jgi:murein DD-endopeptidase MepM/ murein hydrolase activator NlpD
MLLKTESFNQIRQERETLRKNYKQMAQIAHDRDVQVASLGALANEVTAIYGLRQNRAHGGAAPQAASAPAPMAVEMNPENVTETLDTFYALRDQAMSGRVTRALESGLSSSFMGDWTLLADAPSIWPVEGRIGSGFGSRQDPINGEGAFHSGIDIDAPYGTPVRAAADGEVAGADFAAGYGRQILISHGHDVMTVYGHLSSMAVVPGEHVSRGQIIGYVGQSGRATGPHLHYEVRVHNVPVNPHKYMRNTYDQVASVDRGSAAGSGN